MKDAAEAIAGAHNKGEYRKLIAHKRKHGDGNMSKIITCPESESPEIEKCVVSSPRSHDFFQLFLTEYGQRACVALFRPIRTTVFLCRLFRLSCAVRCVRRCSQSAWRRHQDKLGKLEHFLHASAFSFASVASGSSWQR